MLYAALEQTRVGFILLLLCPATGCSTGGDPSVPFVSDSSAAEVTTDSRGGESEQACSGATCVGAGMVCRANVCVDDCRLGSSSPCGTGTSCDYRDGRCKDPSSECFTPGTFEPCATPGSPKRVCGPGLMCDGNGACVAALNGCTGVACDDDGRCWGISCSCERPAPKCTPAALVQLNRADFVGSLKNDRDGEGAFELDFDDICNAYVATMISGPDYVRQLTPLGELSEWTSTTNLNMGQVAALRTVGEFKELGEIAATYICCAACGCVETGSDGRLGVIRLDRSSATRPLPNVLPAKPTTGTGPFGDPLLDTGPYGLTWGPDRSLYIGNVETNGDFRRIDLGSSSSKLVATFPARVTAATIFDLLHLLVAVEGGVVHSLNLSTGAFEPWAKLAGDVTSLRRDRFTGRVYAEIRNTPPEVVEIGPTGVATTWNMPPRLGRIAIAPDGFVYHLSVFPRVEWKAKTAVVRWPLPSKR